MTDADSARLGANYLGEGRCQFRVWAPRCRQVDLRLTEPDARLLPMQSVERGYFELTVDDAPPGTRYFYRLDGERDRPDPASRWQPDGVHHASAVVEHDFAWTDGAWRGRPLHEYVTYELHVGAYSAEGTFEGVIAHLDDLRELGVTAIELMPVAQCPGGRNWGYDGVHLFAPQNTYGEPRGLKRLVDAAHQRGLAVVLDVVYNHLGPEGNYLGEFGPYFTPRYRTPWGEAVNVDDRGSDEVRRFFLENARYWIEDFHIDALRLDAVHAIYDSSARPFLRELADFVRSLGATRQRHVFTIAESSANDPRVVQSASSGGYGIDAQWNDDFHHALRTLLTDERGGYYADFHGLPDLVKAHNAGWVLDGRYSEFRGRRHGRSGRDLPRERLVVCDQNHDQVGNRFRGDRLSEILTFEQRKLVAAVVLWSPFQPLLFMGEEYGESAPFQFFVSHLDLSLVEAVRQGRLAEFASFGWDAAPPDPYHEATYLACKLRRDGRHGGQGRALWEFYAAALRLRRENPALAYPDGDRAHAQELTPHSAMSLHRWALDNDWFMLYHFGREPALARMAWPSGSWDLVVDSTDSRWEGPGSSAPRRLDSSGEADIVLPPTAALAYRKV